MKKDIFIGDLLEEVGKLSEVKSFNLRFPEYKIKKIEGMKFVVGEGKAENLLVNEKEIFDSPDLLFSLLRLSPGDSPINSPSEIHIPDKEILKWVKKYGIPYQDKELNFKLNDELIRDDVLHIDGFKRKLFWLHGLFHLWKALIEEEEEGIKKFQYSLQFFVQLENFINPEIDSEKLLKSAIATKISESFSDISLRLIYNKETNKYEFTLTASSLFDIAYFQLAALMTKSRSENKKKMKKCALCGSVFWAHHGHQKYCSMCPRQTAWSRKQKQKG